MWSRSRATLYPKPLMRAQTQFRFVFKSPTTLIIKCRWLCKESRRVVKAEDQVAADLARPAGQLQRPLKRLSRPGVRSSTCGCSSISCYLISRNGSPLAGPSRNSRNSLPPPGLFSRNDPTVLRWRGPARDIVRGLRSQEDASAMVLRSLADATAMVLW